MNKRPENSPIDPAPGVLTLSTRQGVGRINRLLISLVACGFVGFLFFCRFQTFEPDDELKTMPLWLWLLLVLGLIGLAIFWARLRWTWRLDPAGLSEDKGRRHKFVLWAAVDKVVLTEPVIISSAATRITLQLNLVASQKQKKIFCDLLERYLGERFDFSILHQPEPKTITHPWRLLLVVLLAGAWYGWGIVYLNEHYQFPDQRNPFLPLYFLGPIFPFTLYMIIQVLRYRHQANLPRKPQPATPH